MNAMVKAARREVKAALQRVSGAADLSAMSDRELLELIRESPLPGQLVGQAQAARQTRREELVARKERELAAVEREIPALVEQRTAARDAVVQAEAALEAAKRGLSDAENELRARGYRSQSLCAAIDGELELSAPDVIAAAITRAETEWEQLRSRGVLIAMPTRPRSADAESFGVRDPERDAVIEHTRMENQQAGLRMDGLGAVMRALEALKLTTLHGEALLAEIASIEGRWLELGQAARAAQGYAT
jgi:chromosome segregation ATPase